MLCNTRSVGHKRATTGTEIFEFFIFVKESYSGNLKISFFSFFFCSSGTPVITCEQARAEELYTQAMQVLKQGLMTKSSDQLRNASDILAESLKVFRLGTCTFNNHVAP